MTTAILGRQANRFRVLLFLSWRNIWRNPVRSVLTLSAFAFGLTLMIAYGALIEGMSRQMVRFATEHSLGHLQIHRQRFTEDQDLYSLLPDDLVARLNAGEVPGLRAAPRLYAAALASSGAHSTGAFLRGVDPALEPAVSTLDRRVRVGTYELGLWRDPLTGEERAQVVVGRHLAKALHLEPGSELILVTQAADGSIGNELYRVSGVLQIVDPVIDRAGVILSVEAYGRLMALERGVHEVAVVTEDIGRLAEFQTAIQAALRRWGIAEAPKAQGGPARVRRWDEINPAIADIIAVQDGAAAIVSAIFFGLAGLGLLNTMLMSVFERTREFSVLLALGMGRLWLMGMVLLESLCLTAVSVVGGMAGGWALSRYLETHGWDFSRWLPEGFDFQGVVMEPVFYGYLTPRIVVNAVLLMTAIAVLAALLPAWRTARVRLVLTER
jgi:ABC-type lipoprotein release transport system permease subunit